MPSKSLTQETTTSAGGDTITSHSDRRLVDSVAGTGDEEAFRRLYDRHTPRLLRFVLRLTAGMGRQTAEETVQETWIRAVERFDRFDGRSGLDTWLHGIALNVVREDRRRRPEDRHARLTDGERASPAATDSPIDAETRIDLERALARLPRGRREVLVLHDLYGYTHADVAASLGISIGTSKSQLHDARRQLQSILTREKEA